MNETKFYTTTSNCMINISHIVSVESHNGSTYITLDARDSEGGNIVILDATPWAEAASKIESLSKNLL